MPAAAPLSLIPCPACGHQLSPQALSCPQCGHPIAAAAVLPHESEASRLAGTLLLVGISLLTLGTGATVVKVVTAGRAEVLGETTLLTVFLQTAPLTIAVTLIALAMIRKWFAETSSTLFFAGLMLLLSVYVGSCFGGLGNLPSIQGNLGTVFFKTMSFYWRHYGPSLFLSSLLLGVFLARVLSQQWEVLVVQGRRWSFSSRKVSP